MTAKATLAGGCFWCVEAPLKELVGVESAVSGYTGGSTDDPSYEAVCSGTTGHAEAVQVTYDPDAISYEEILEVFFSIHDPTTKDQQGADVGSQYRSAIFYHDTAQQERAEAFIEELEAATVYDDPIVTQVAPMETFYEAEAYHQDYYEKNASQGYCRINVAPKLRKVREKFRERVEPHADQP
jgi:peptide-methionine (S)-S-oxide reductase